MANTIVILELENKIHATRTCCFWAAPIELLPIFIITKSSTALEFSAGRIFCPRSKWDDPSHSQPQCHCSHVAEYAAETWPPFGSRELLSFVMKRLALERDG